LSKSLEISGPQFLNLDMGCKMGQCNATCPVWHCPKGIFSMASALLSNIIPLAGGLHRILYLSRKLGFSEIYVVWTPGTVSLFLGLPAWEYVE